MTMPPPVERPIGLRTGLRRLSTGLLVYGIVGLVLAILGLVSLLYVGNRVTSVAEGAGSRVDTLVATVEDTAAVLHSSAVTANSFAATLERTPPAVRQAADTIEGMRQSFVVIEQRLDDITILGSRPFGGIADQFAQLAADLEGLDVRLDGIATDLEDNKTRLLETATSLNALGDRLDDVADELASGFIQDGLDDVRLIITTMGLLLVLWTALPAVGALLFGAWLRRNLGTERR